MRATIAGFVLAAGWLSSTLLGCQSDVPSSPSMPTAAAAGSGGTTPTASADELGTTAIVETNAKGISRLTAAQFLRSAAALVGDAAVVGAEEKLTLREAWTGPAYSNAGFNQATGKHDIQDFDDAATYIVEHISDWSAFYARWGGCQQSSCVDTFLQSFLEAAFRRPPTTADLAAFQPILQAAGTAGLSFDETSKLVIRATLQSFEFLYLSWGENLDDFQLASRLSYFVSDGPPDAALYAAAKANRLHEPAELGAQVDRLLATNIDGFSRAFARDYFELNAAFLRVGDPVSQRQLAASALDSFAALVQQNSTVDAIMTTTSFVVNEGTASWLGLAGPAQTLSPSAQYPFLGMMTHPAVLMAISNEDKGSTISRGLALSEHFLCVAPPPNPPAGVQAKQSEFNLPPDATARQKAEARLGSATCAGCHSMFEPFSFALNHWDASGRYDADPLLVDNGPITTTLGTISFADYREFLQKVARSEEFRDCVSEHLIRYGLQHTTFDSDLRTTVMQQALQLHPAGLTFQALIKALVLQPTFAQR
jgi:hypothetical protein